MTVLRLILLSVLLIMSFENTGATRKRQHKKSQRKASSVKRAKSAPAQGQRTKPLAQKQEATPACGRFDDYVEELELGRGGFGTVHLVRHKKTKEKYARKQVNLTPSNREEI